MRFGCLTLAFVLLAGCSWLSDDKGLFVDRSDDYIDAREGPELLIPNDLGVRLDEQNPVDRLQLGIQRFRFCHVAA